MNNRNGLLALAFVSAAALAACGSIGDGEHTAAGPGFGPPTLGTVISSPTATPVTSFPQNVRCRTVDAFLYPCSEFFPGQANVWAINNDFTLVNDQIGTGLMLTVSDPIAGPWPFDMLEDYSRLTFYTPTMRAAEGVKVAAVSNGVSIGMFPLEGNYSAFLNATSDSRLQQTLNLTQATAPITLTWTDSVSLDYGLFMDYTPSYRVVVRDLAGNELQELVPATTFAPAAVHSEDLSAYAGLKVVLSFEERSSISYSFMKPYVIIDDVSVRDGNGSKYERNGDFESRNLVGWTTNSPNEVQNITSGVQNLAQSGAFDPFTSEPIPDGFDVTRSFYTAPDKKWGRWVDVFENNTTKAMTKTIRYDTYLGSGGAGVIYWTPVTGFEAVTSWDSTGMLRDIGLVFGNVFVNPSRFTNVQDPLLTFMSDDGTGSGSDQITTSYDITMPAHGRAVIVHFIIMDGVATGQSALDPITSEVNTNAKAAAIDAEAENIVKNFWIDPQYRNGMTQEQINSIWNFAKR
jgi:hypothetical protein